MNIKNCFSYIRFSSSRQADGSSVERQSPIAARVANEQGWIYRPELNAADLGISAFKGDNTETIRAIIAARKADKIPTGTVLILEALDRATRLKLDDAQQLIRDILKSGLEIYTDMNKRHLTAESLNNVTDVMLTAIELDAAFQYAHRLSERSKNGLKKHIAAIERGEKVYLGGQMPSLIEGVRDGKFILNTEKMSLVRRIFSEYLSGQTLYSIAVQFNEEVKKGKLLASLKRKSANKWDRQTIKHILTNPAYVGDLVLMQKVYKDYLPAVVKRKDLETIQLRLKQNTKRRGSSSGNINSIFNGVAKCSVCGNPMTAIISTTNGKKYSSYGCSSARYKKCKAKGWLNTYECELDFVMLFLQTNPLQLIDANTAKTNDETIALKAEIAELEQQILVTIKLIKGGSAVAQLQKQLHEFDSAKIAKEQELQDLASKQLNTKNVPMAVENIKKILKGIKSPKTIDKATVAFDAAARNVKAILRDNDTRKKLVTLIPQLVKRVSFDIKKGGYTVTNHQDKESKFFSLVG